MMGRIGIIGGGPAGLMAAEVLSAAGHGVSVFEAMPTVGRKFLLAGKSGLNLTHGEDHAVLRQKFGAAGERLAGALNGFTGADVRAWATGLGTETFVGSSGRVFPKAMKASPLLRAWLGRLAGQGVEILTRRRWVGFEGEALVFERPEGRVTKSFDAVVLALGGASWPRLGSDAAWVPWLVGRGVEVTPFRAANCGFEVAWSAVVVERFAGAPVKAVTGTSEAGTSAGEFVVSASGIEGSLVYAHAAGLRDRLERIGAAEFVIDLVPGRSVDRLAEDLGRQDRKVSFANRVRKAAGIEGVKAGLLREFLGGVDVGDPEALARRIKAVAIPVVRTRPIAEAISSAGGVAFEGVDGRFMLKKVPGVFVAGEMLDWEAPTGGYLLTACLATGKVAACGVMDWLGERKRPAG